MHFFLGCGDLIQLLEKCHRTNIMHQVFGGCNNQKNALVDCLHADTVERRRSHLKATTIKRNALEKRWKEMEEEEYGPGGYLKQVRDVKVQKPQEARQPALESAPKEEK